MSNMSEDIQYAGSDTRPPMLDKTDFESWQQQIRLYCLGKDNGENIMKSITEGPFQMGTVSDMITAGTEGAFQQGPVRARVLPEPFQLKKRKALKLTFVQRISYFKMILEGSELTKDDMESQIYDEFEHFCQIKAYLKQTLRCIMPQLSRILTTDNLIQSLTTYLPPHVNSYKSHFLKEQSTQKFLQTQEQSYSQDGKLLFCPGNQGRYNANNQGTRCSGNNARGGGGTRNVEGIGNKAENVPQPKSPQDSILQIQDAAYECSRERRLPTTTQTMFMANLTSKEARPSYDSNIPSEVQDLDIQVNHK
ncbi:hypothetical protein Tco_0010759 [Tanacetum coccineum]